MRNRLFRVLPPFAQLRPAVPGKRTAHFSSFRTLHTGFAGKFREIAIFRLVSMVVA